MHIILHSKMDGSNVDHSDSDSGDSWTLLENNSIYAEDAPDTADHPSESITPENQDKDEDTDGISIITDSEPDSPSPCQINYEHYLTEENSTMEHHIPQFIPVNSHLHNIQDHNESEKDEDDFLGDSRGKHKTYVHRRNKRLSTVLNIIMLGSVITAAGVAIGHMWGARTDCSQHTTTNVNKILSNLYKLQEENAYLRSKLKELTAFNNYQINQQKASKQNNCKKMFEGPLMNIDTKKVVKCVDDKVLNENLPNSHLAEVAYENNYQENHQKKKWLHGAQKHYQEEELKKLNHKHISKSFKNNPGNNERENHLNKLPEIKEHVHSNKEKPNEYLDETIDLANERKSYADSVKFNEKEKTINKRENRVPKGENKLLHENSKLINKQHDSEIDPTLSNLNNLVDLNMNIREDRGKMFEIKENYSKNDNKPKDEYGYTNNFLHNKDSKKDFNKLKGEYGSNNDFIIHEKYQTLKKKGSNRTFNKTPKDEYETEEKYVKSLEDKNINKDYQKESTRGFGIESKDFDRKKTPKSEHGTEEKFSKSLKGKKQSKKAYETENKYYDEDKNPKEKYGTAEEYLKDVKEKNHKKDYQKQKNKAFEMNSKDNNENKAPKEEYGTEEEFLKTMKETNLKKDIQKQNKVFDTENKVKNQAPKSEFEPDNKRESSKTFKTESEKLKGEDGYQFDISDEDFKKDNRYNSHKQKQERKKYDRQQSHKKIKRRNKYEQWEMKGGLFKDYDEISWTSSQDNVYLFHGPNIVHDKNRNDQLSDNTKNKVIDKATENVNHEYIGYFINDSKNTKQHDKEELNWLDKRAMLRMEARQKLEQEFGKNGVNAAGWYFRRMRKREQSRGNDDNSTHRKILKRNMNLKLKH